MDQVVVAPPLLRPLPLLLALRLLPLLRLPASLLEEGVLNPRRDAPPTKIGGSNPWRIVQRENAAQI
jgi:hypothetical protein